MTFTALAWGQPQVDATTGTATDTLTFTVRDGAVSDASGGRAIIAARTTGGAGGFSTTYYGVAFGDIVGQQFLNDAHAALVSTDGLDRTYSYTFPVPRYGSATSVTWAVEDIAFMVSPTDGTSMTDADLTAAGFQDDFAATTLVDTTQPGFDSVTTTNPLSIAEGTEGKVTWAVHVHDAESGAWHVTLTVAGPGGKVLHLTSASSELKPGATLVTDGVITVAPVFVPPSEPYGVWTVQEVDVTDAAGNVGTYSGLSLAPVTFTGNTAITATGFALNPDPVNAWSADQTVDLTASVTGPAPVTSVALDAGPGCVAGDPILPGSATGTVTLPITVAAGTVSCKLKGIAFTDAAGDVSAYGTDFAGSATALPTVTEQTGPAPEVTSISLDTSTLTWASGGTVTAHVGVSSWGPGVTKVQLLATPAGATHAIEADVTLNRVPDGVVTVALAVPPRSQLGTYEVVARATDAAGSTGVSSQRTFTVVATGGVSAYVPMDQPIRVIDTRGWDTLGPNSSIDVGFVTYLPVTVPDNATAVVVNVTAINPTASSYLTVWPAGRPRPAVSNLNVTPGQTVAKLATVPIGARSMISIYNHVGSVDVAVDVLGYYVPDGGADFVPLTPSRVVDTRSGTGVPEGQVTGGHPVVSSVNVPSTATAVVFNVTVTDATAASNLSVQAWSATQSTSTLNFAPGETVANVVVVPVSTYDHDFEIINHYGGVDVLVDLVGYYDGDQAAATRPMVFVPADPVRVLDTRNGVGAPRAALGPAGQVGIPVAGAPGAPAGTAGAVLNVTAVGGTANSYLTTWPDGTPRPGTSTVNFAPGQTVPNPDMAATGSDGKVAVWNHVGSVQVLADVFGYFVSVG